MLDNLHLTTQGVTESESPLGSSRCADFALVARVRARTGCIDFRMPLAWGRLPCVSDGIRVLSLRRVAADH